MRRRFEPTGSSVMLDVAFRAVAHSVVVFSLYLLLAGHNRPGGGFAAGLVAGAGLALAYAAGGARRVRTTVPVSPWTVIGLGGLVAFVTAFVPLLLGGAFLESGSVSLDLPVVGVVKLYSVLAFDTGVFLVVVGGELAALETLGATDDDAVPDDVATEDGHP